MSDTTAIATEPLKRIPGLYRRWELPEIFEVQRRYHIEEAGMARNRAVMGLPPIHPHSASGLLLDEGIFGRSTAELDPDYVEKIRKRAAAAILMLRTADHDASGTTGRLPSVLVHAIVCYEVDAANWGTADLRNLEHGLEALITLFGINRGSSTPVSSA